MSDQPERRTERAYRTKNPDGIDHLVVAGWHPDEFGYYVQIAETTGGDWHPVFDSRERCNCRVTFPDVTFILCRHNLTYPSRWANRLLSDNPMLKDEPNPDRITDYGFHPKFRRSPESTE